ncbi:hypothetical protein QFZ75_003585 [Streptomyces sp. V3I8]|uniref:hypothetical protein n=1 Tax=Streptomyces sp. V3I8 TaxID=3042279 RepID=UPI00278A342D|nr:hypothetical protein [Streptomyces sp. V3I8]MDQ1037169.1 hypothetical protein [Streptomyces sp. V3I8]
MLIKNVSHTLVSAGPGSPGGSAGPSDPAGFALALAVAYELHAPAPRAPELAAARAPRGTARRSSAAARTRTRRTARG